jgi:hypothetical protein
MPVNDALTFGQTTRHNVILKTRWLAINWFASRMAQLLTMYLSVQLIFAMT